MRRARSAFTLIELMIAIGLGLVLIYTAAAGFRVAARSVTIANHMSLENSMLRAGYLAAHEELDFWTSLDDATDITRQKLRASGGTGTTGGPQGLPFTPFATVYLRSGGADVLADDESDTGWDPRDIAWSVNNPRSWYAGNMVEKCSGGTSDLRFGRYAMFTNTKRTPGTADFHAFPVTFGPLGGDGKVAHSWYGNQVQGLIDALGFYGLCEYMPANAIYELYRPDRSDGNDWFGTNPGGIPGWCNRPNGGDDWFNNDDGVQLTARGKYRNTYMTAYAIANPDWSPTGAPLSDNRRKHRVGYQNDANAMNTFNAMTSVPYRLLADRPATWPQVSVAVVRFIKNTRHVALCKVRWVSPLSGETVELSFAGFGTSLRGARQQRARSGGWAEWDNNTPNGTFSSPPANLDSY
ncbi:MAG: prepilin-type N-terminal cleavage/methylation domain-containing protein [Planctomycetes bacterium]|nr:prepilin-type N-terminal cleavage/methylation domain-containing protein [Planctomycetota bacterium]